ncbi:OmpA family protein [Hymenobacter mucosus]|uniref:Outer membrane protein OmpA n=1 Tax=Hymenobacter mucosus TaxID=1411120 RepID=A0A238V936_9BACT|nr:OmpA family protein [Hymenobacter mucosus]SNR30930.1 Outer membrane protein OmpA [Hymenobacter mucosus]
MKNSTWYRILVVFLGVLLVKPGQAQSLAGIWQGVETDSREPGQTWPSEMRVQKGKDADLFGILYQEVGEQPNISVTFQVEATRTAAGMRLDHVRKLTETGRSPVSYWCEGSISFTYDPKLEKLTGQATYQPVGDCDIGSFTFYRVKLQSAATVRANAATTIRVSGRDVRWYADAELKKPLATGNSYATKLRATTTYYLTQGYHPTRQRAVTPITINVTGAGAAPKPAAPVPPRQVPLPTPPDTARLDTVRRNPAPLVVPTPVVLPTVLFHQGKADLLPESRPALNQLATELMARPTLKLRIAGHTDRVGEPEKNQVLSEQRAEAVKAYLVKAGIAAERISTIGYGDSRPLYPSPDVRNRRVEVSQAAE